MNKKNKLFLFFSLISYTFFAKNTLAVCPVCIVAVGAGVGLSRFLGIDDTISGTWIGGLIVSITAWTFSWFKKKEWNSPFLKIGTIILFFSSVILPLYFQDILGHPQNTLYGIDKLLLGIALGSVVFLLGSKFHLNLKEKNKGKSYFYFQKVVFPIVFLIILSFVFNFITRSN